MNDIKLFGFDSWSVNSRIDNRDKLVYFQPAYTSTLFEDGQLMGRWPTTVSSSDGNIRWDYSYIRDVGASSFRAEFLDGTGNTLSHYSVSAGGYVGCSVTPWQ